LCLSGEVLSDCKRETSCPFLKQGKKKHPENYQPVSLTSMPSNIMEQILLSIHTVLWFYDIFCSEAVFYDFFFKIFNYKSVSVSYFCSRSFITGDCERE